VPAPRSFVDLHSHTSASFDSLASPAAMVRAAIARGVTHLAITDHDRISGALEAREVAATLAGEPAEAGGTGEAVLVVLVGEEIRSRDGDLIGVFLTDAVPPGLSAAETIAAVHEQGGLVGIPHPFDRARPTSLSRSSGGPSTLEAMASSVDWIETWNARVMLGNGNQRAAELALEAGVPGVAVSDAHTVMEIGIAATILDGDPSTAEGLRAALAAGPRLVTGRGSAYARLVTPAAKVVQRLRGRGRVYA
jgi:predicted metal-dependent phosphoesterase TrpH